MEKKGGSRKLHSSPFSIFIDNPYLAYDMTTPWTSNAVIRNISAYIWFI